MTTTMLRPPVDRVELKKLKPDYDDPGLLPRTEAERIVENCLPGFWFINPVKMLYAPEESSEAARIANKIHDRWFHQLHRRRKNVWQKERRRINDRMSLAYAYDGVVVIQNVILPYTWWRDCWNNQIDATKVFTPRSQADDCLKVGDISALIEIQTNEVHRILQDTSKDDDRVHVVFPHLTISMPPKTYLEERVRREGSAWKQKLKGAVDHQGLAAIPPAVRLGQIIRGDSVAILCNNNLTNLLSSEGSTARLSSE